MTECEMQDFKIVKLYITYMLMYLFLSSFSFQQIYETAFIVRHGVAIYNPALYSVGLRLKY